MMIVFYFSDLLKSCYDRSISLSSCLRQLFFCAIVEFSVKEILLLKDVPLLVCLGNNHLIRGTILQIVAGCRWHIYCGIEICIKFVCSVPYIFQVGDQVESSQYRIGLL